VRGDREQAGAFRLNVKCIASLYDALADERDPLKYWLPMRRGCDGGRICSDDNLIKIFEYITKSIFHLVSG
jgi:hypothetical protein